jgi:heterodisulfide reductase subunit A-like polyferredoxin
VVLSNGICPQTDADQVADMFNLDLAASGFIASPGSASSTPGLSTAGVFVAGTCRQPMRIDDCVADASAVSNQVLKHLGMKVYS